MSTDSRKCCVDKKCKGLVFILIHFSHRETSIELVTWHWNCKTLKVAFNHMPRIYCFSTETRWSFELALLSAVQEAEWGQRRSHCYKQLPDLVKIFSLLSADGVKGLPLLTHPKEELQGNFFLFLCPPTSNFATFFLEYSSTVHCNIQKNHCIANRKLQ